MPTMVSMGVLLLSFKLFLCFLVDGVNTSTQTCYKSGGSEDAYPKPCPNSSMCCYLNRNDNYPDDVCLAGGICQSNAGDMTGEYFVVACTNSDTSSRECSAAWKVCGGF